MWLGPRVCVCVCVCVSVYSNLVNKISPKLLYQSSPNYSTMFSLRSSPDDFFGGSIANQQGLQTELTLFCIFSFISYLYKFKF